MHHDESPWRIMMGHHDASWWLWYHDASWRGIMMHHDGGREGEMERGRERESWLSNRLCSVRTYIFFGVTTWQHCFDLCFVPLHRRRKATFGNPVHVYFCSRSWFNGSKLNRTLAANHLILFRSMSPVAKKLKTEGSIESLESNPLTVSDQGFGDQLIVDQSINTDRYR